MSFVPLQSGRSERTSISHLYRCLDIYHPRPQHSFERIYIIIFAVLHSYYSFRLSQTHTMSNPNLTPTHAPTSRILELSTLISSSTQKINEVLTASDLPLPSFEIDPTLTLPSELDSARDTLLDATSELHDLLYGFQNILSQYGSVRVCS